MGTLTYISNFFKDRYVASLVPTFSWAIRSACASIDFSQNLVIIEYGSGTGVFTKYLLRRMSSRSALIAIERNEGMFKVLSRRFKDPRLHIQSDSAESVRQILEARGVGPADYVISGIPFSLFPEEMTRRIIRETAAVLKNEGEFIVYQCLWTHKQQAILEMLQHNFERVDSDAVPLNIPPLTVYRAKGPKKALDT